MLCLLLREKSRKKSKEQMPKMKQRRLRAMFRKLVMQNYFAFWVFHYFCVRYTVLIIYYLPVTHPQICYSICRYWQYYENAPNKTAQIKWRQKSYLIKINVKVAHFMSANFTSYRLLIFYSNYRFWNAFSMGAFLLDAFLKYCLDIFYSLHPPAFIVFNHLNWFPIHPYHRVI